MLSHPISRRALAVGGLVGASSLVLGSRLGRAASAAKLNFQSIWLNDPEFLGYMLAIDKGYYGEVGLDINYMPGGPNVVSEGSLLTGKADVALTQMLTTATAVIEKGAPFKIIGVQFQKSPLGIVSLESSNIKGPKDLAGKTVAVPTLNTQIFAAFTKLHGIADKVKVVPYAFNPAPLINGEVDATVDFVTQIPFIVEQKSGKKASYLLFDDHGLPLFMDLVTVTSDTFAKKRGDLVKFIRASRKGWAENFKDPLAYPKIYHETWFKGSGSTVEAEEFFNKLQPGLMQNPKGIYTLSDADIEANLESLSKVGIKANKSMFDTSLVAEV
jgi:ABC-type nitrate/sulfonate/bicarbonate transport system substrate-binding protein